MALVSIKRTGVDQRASVVSLLSSGSVARIDPSLMLLADPASLLLQVDPGLMILAADPTSLLLQAFPTSSLSHCSAVSFVPASSSLLSICRWKVRKHAADKISTIKDVWMENEKRAVLPESRWYFSPPLSCPALL